MDWVEENEAEGNVAREGDPGRLRPYRAGKKVAVALRTMGRCNGLRKALVVETMPKCQDVVKRNKFPPFRVQGIGGDGR